MKHSVYHKRHRTIKVISFFVLLSALGLPSVVSAETISYWDSEAKYQNARIHTMEDLQGLGCALIQPNGAVGRSGVTITIPDDKPVLIRATDQTDQDYGYEIGVAQLPPGDYFSYMACPQSVADELEKKGLLDSSPATSKSQRIAIWLINRIFWLFAVVGGWLLHITSYFLGKILAARSFITHPMVSTGWPFVQGIANLGFMVALLFIAFATTLRIDSYGARRMLPRLITAAILLNFSLVIAGLLIDVSRLVMAIMVNLIPTPLIDGKPLKLAEIGAGILGASDLVQGVFDTTTSKIGTVGLKQDTSSWDVTRRVAQSTILIWFLAGGFAVITVGLLIRYVMLILLLIVSPVAYLAFAFPGADNAAKKWWTAFLKYLLYGPIALFILLMIVALNNQSKDVLGNAKDGNNFMSAVISVGVTAALCVAAASAGKSLGTIGANASINMVTRRGKQILGGTALAASYPFRYIGRGAQNQAKDLAKEVKKGATTAARSGKFGGVVKTIVGPERDDKGNLKKGQTSTGKEWAKSLNKRLGLVSPQKEAEKKLAKKASLDLVQDKDRGYAPGTTSRDKQRVNKEEKQAAMLLPTNLAEEHVLEALGDAGINFILEQGDGKALQAIAQNTDYLRTLKNSSDGSIKLEAMQEAIVKNTVASPEAKEKALNNLVRNIKEINKE